MATFPVRLHGCTFHDLDQLIADLDARGRGHLLDHPGQAQAADHYLPMIDEDPDLGLAVSEAAAALVSTTSDPGVLLLCAHVGPGASPPFFSAVLDRLDGTGPPLPDAPGAPGPRLVDDLHRALGHGTVMANASLRRRMTDTLVRLGALEALISNLAGGDPDGRLPWVLEQYSRHEPLSALHVGLAAHTIAQSQPQALLALAPRFATAESSVRERLVAKVERANPPWFAQHGTQLRRALGLRSGPAPR